MHLFNFLYDSYTVSKKTNKGTFQSALLQIPYKMEFIVLDV